ncbi:Coenzyme F420 hydrogenase/dehydrogenase, beta subunit C-terminal domain, partial [Candidatus Bathyarchaeota archaeon]|nr:Coenzyme F420 hydrogenase/dehydrogenase, beta subunit C-terminal domain [Candidatus Bathyarchaeota archaeon]
MKTSRDLIAYNDLKKMIIEPGFCNLCGACEAACPVHALKIEDRSLKYTHDCTNFMEFCPICYDICPFTEALLLETLGFVSGAPNRTESIGYYRKIILAQAVDERMREISHSGGVITALLMHAIKTGFIDGAITSESEKETPIRIKPLLSLVPDDLLSAVDYEYFPSSVAKAFGRAVHEYGKTKIAFVGTPCHVRAIRKLEAWEHKIMNSLKIVIGLICLWSFSFPKLTKYLKEAYNIDASDILRIDLDKKYDVSMKDGRIISISIPEIEAHTLSVCKMCEDFTS